MTYVRWYDEALTAASWLILWKRVASLGQPKLRGFSYPYYSGLWARRGDGGFDLDFGGGDIAFVGGHRHRRDPL
jgi:hypothetical protein